MTPCVVSSRRTPTRQAWRQSESGGDGEGADVRARLGSLRAAARGTNRLSSAMSAATCSMRSPSARSSPRRPPRPSTMRSRQQTGARRRLPLWQLRRRQHERQNGGEARRQGWNIEVSDRRRQRRRLLRAARRARKASRRRRRDLHVEVRLAAKAALGGEPERGAARWRRRRSTIAARIGVGSRALHIARGRPSEFRYRARTMEVGIGHHGEPGVASSLLKTARGGGARDGRRRSLTTAICRAGTEVAVLISGLGATPTNGALSSSTTR